MLKNSKCFARRKGSIEHIGPSSALEEVLVVLRLPAPRNYALVLFVFWLGHKTIAVRTKALVFRLLGRQIKGRLGNEAREESLRLGLELVALGMGEHQAAAKRANDLEKLVNLANGSCPKTRHWKLDVAHMSLTL